MEDDDEFGDLYTDVLQPFQKSSAPPQAPIQSTQQPPSRSIDLNDRIPSDDEEILYGSKSSINPKFDQSVPNLNLNIRDGAGMETENCSPAADLGGRVFGSSSSGLVKAEGKGFEQGVNFVDGVNKGEFSQIKDETMEENFGIEDAGGEDEFLIPGLSSSGARAMEYGGKEGEIGDDWDDSDSEDDLQIVLNDNTGMGMMGMDGGGGPDEEDEDGDNLVIVTGDLDPNHHQPMEELQDWGEDGGQAGEGGGERKDLLGGDAGKADGGAAAAQKMGYSGHGYHPFHSQFKYVRPGAAPMPGAAPGAAPGQVRPPANMLPFAGRGRGEWRAPGIKSGPLMQKVFHPGYGMPGWGNNGAGRGFGSGLDFTLPSHKTIFEVDIDGFEEKPWRLQGIDISDFFNFGMNEETWKEYCKQLEQHRMEATMQSKIRVYESGRTEQEYDPDLPPELAAAAGHDISSENRNLVKTDMQSDLAKGSVRARMQLPTGKAIQVETGFGERLPSIDTRPPRIRDSDAIIEIVLQRSPSPDHESIPGEDVADHLEDVPSKEDHQEDVEIEDEIGLEDDHFDKPHGYNGGRKREVSGRISHFSETEVEDNLDKRGRTSSYPTKKLNSPRNYNERPMKRTAADRSPRLTDSENPHDKNSVDNQNEESTESVDHKQSPSSPVTHGSDDDRSFDQHDGNKEYVVVADGNTNNVNDTFKDEKPKRTMKNQKLINRGEHSSDERGEDRDDSKAGRSSENSRDIEHEVLQSRGSIHNGNIRKLNENEHNVRTRGRDDKYERERHQMSIKGTWDPNQGYRGHVKSENYDRKKSRESERVWQDEERMRMEDLRKRSHEEEMASRHRRKARETERSDKNEHRSRKPLENGGWKGDHDRDMIPQLKRDDSLKPRHNISSDKRETSIRESTSRRKRERDDNLDRLQREKVERQRERDEWKERDAHRAGHSRLKEDYRSLDKEHTFKETSRREKFENESVSRHRGREDLYVAHGNKLNINSEERITMHERGYSGSAKDMQEKKHKETLRKGKEADGAIHNSLATSRKNREEHNSQRSERGSSRGLVEQRGSDQNPVARKSSKKHKENVSSEDEQQESKKGRSKLERWTSHKERDFSLGIKESSSLEIKDKRPHTKLPEDSQENLENSKPLVEEKNEDANTKPPEDKHLDTVEKLKKRSERFKLPMPSEKEALGIKKIENEPLTLAQPDARPESEVKPERPARKRRWTSG